LKDLFLIKKTFLLPFSGIRTNPKRIQKDYDNTKNCGRPGQTTQERKA